MAAAAVALAGAAGAQTNKQADPNAWKRPYMINGVKVQLDGCYRAQDQLVVCTYTASSSATLTDSPRWYLNSATITDQVGRKLQPVWTAWGASARRVPAGSRADGASFGYDYVGGGAANMQAGLPVKVSLAYKLAPQYSIIASISAIDGSSLSPLLNVPVTVPGAATGLPTTGTAGKFAVGLTNCILNADSRTYACQATLTPNK